MIIITQIIFLVQNRLVNLCILLFLILPYYISLYWELHSILRHCNKEVVTNTGTCRSQTHSDRFGQVSLKPKVISLQNNSNLLNNLIAKKFICGTQTFCNVWPTFIQRSSSWETTVIKDHLSSNTFCTKTSLIVLNLSPETNCRETTVFLQKGWSFKTGSTILCYQIRGKQWPAFIGLGP